jgi:FMN reductase
MKILGITGSVKGRKTLTAVNEVLKTIKEKDSAIETELLDPAHYDIIYSEGRDYRDYDGDTGTVIQKIMEADAYIIGTPTYQASISGVLKNIFDLLPVDAFNNKVVGIVSTAGSDKHYLMAELQLKPILNYMKALIIPKYVFINEAQFINNEIKDDEILFRVKQLAEDTLNIMEIVREFNQRKNDAYDF